jgi:hypothetical protein
VHVKENLGTSNHWNVQIIHDQNLGRGLSANGRQRILIRQDITDGQSHEVNAIQDQINGITRLCNS